MFGALELIADAQLTLGEGPSWDAENGLLYWVDIEQYRVYTYDPAKGELRHRDVGQYVGAVAPRQGGGLVMALQHGFYTYDPATDTTKLIAEPEAHLPNNRFNDGKCDPAGRFWAGSMSLVGESGTGKLYRLDSDGTATPMVDGVSCSNGLAWSPDQQTMYYIDTPTMQVVAYTYDIDTGDIRDSRTAVRFERGMGAPDGMTIDAEGMLWIAHWGGWRVSRWNPNTGEKLTEIAVPAAHVTSCVFAGTDLTELYITTARTGLDAAALEQQPQAGGIFRVKTDVKGMPTYSYQG